MDLFCEAWGDGMSWVNKSDGGPHEANFLKLDCSKIKNVFGWRPAWGVKEAVERSVIWYKEWAGGGDVTAVMDEQIRQMFFGGENHV